MIKLAVMNKRNVRAVAVVTILLITIGVFIYYFAKHPNIRTQLAQLNGWTLALLLGLYCVFSLAYVFITMGTLRVARAPKIPFKEKVLLAAYSSIINFFGPLQSGPGFRILYLRKRHNVSVKDYTFATLFYYGFFAFFSGLFLCVNVLQWWQTILVLGVIVGVVAFVLRLKKGAKSVSLSAKDLLFLAAATLFQLSIVAVIYFVELHAIDSHVSVAQALTYAGAANFAMFVSLTPGAIGFRESFLLFSQNLHHINSAHVLAASVIDRSVYVLFLGGLFIMSLAVHAQDKLKIKKIKGAPELEP
jgi:uncharacterized membrane protein YbhN (UPF0104 family)